jgi:hypothetical protein
LRAFTTLHGSILSLQSHKNLTLMQIDQDPTLMHADPQPDPAFHSDADPDPAFQNDADP